MGEGRVAVVVGREMGGGGMEIGDVWLVVEVDGLGEQKG